jgi:predicted RNA-binding protein YlxR (DUF448 family)
MLGKKLRHRSCIACRRLDSRTELIRTVLIGNEIKVDLNLRMGGRGAWLHANCLKIATERRSFNHAFKFKGEIKTHEIDDYFKNLGN